MRKKEKKSQKETRIQTSPRWKRKIFPKESEWNSAIKEEQKKERKKEISPSLLALYSSFQSRLARTHYSLSSFFEEEGRRAPSLTIVPEDGQGSMTPKFTKRRRPSLSPPSIAKFENRWILVSRVFQPNSLQEHWEGQSCTREQRYSITNFAFLVPSSRTVARFSGRAVIFIYSNLDAHKIECNDFLF